MLQSNEDHIDLQKAYVVLNDLVQSHFQEHFSSVFCRATTLFFNDLMKNTNNDALQLFLIPTCHAKYCTRSKGSTTYCNKGNHTSSPFRSLHRRHGIVISVTAEFLSVLSVFCLCTLSRSHFSEPRTLVMLHVQF